MNEEKPKRHRRTKKELLAAGYYTHQNDGKKDENTHQNDGKQKRIRRTKAQLIADGYYDNKDKNKKTKKIDFMALNQKITETKEKSEEIFNSVSKMKTMDEICEEQIQRAKDKNLPNPDFDFRNSYSKGQIIYYVETNELVGTKKMLELKISSVYPRAIIAYEDMGMAHTIGFEDDEMIFLDRRDAESVYESTTVENKLEEYFQRQKQLANKRRREENGNA